MSGEWFRQILWAASGVLLMVTFALIDYRRWKGWSLPAYGAVLLLLILVLLVGNYVKGARARIGIGAVGIQPSEFGKLAVIVLLAWWFEDRGRGQNNFRTWLSAIGMTALPMFLILAQPDLGTAIVYIPIFLAISFAAGVDWRLLVFPLLAGLLMIAGILGYAWSEHIANSTVSFFLRFTEWRLIRIIVPALLFLALLLGGGWLLFRKRIYLSLLYGYGIIATAYMGITGAARVLRGYQMMRLVVFLDPQIDPRGAGWHIIQSVTAVGSGGMMGKGFLQGTQSHYRYLPEQSTDFIFSILAEEMGFIGGLLVFGLFAIIIVRALYIGFTSQDRFGTYVAVGIAAMIGFHVMQNIGMAIGVMPITGIPLFFLSYGGSSLWMVMMSVGLLLSIHYRRYRN